MKSRPTKQKLKQRGILKERVFGCDLGEHLLNSGFEVPQVLQSCTAFIERYGIVDGIYRLSGVASNIQRLRHEFDSEHVPDLTKEPYVQDIHSVGSLCKLYFRELPNPLLTYQLYEKFSDAVSAATDEERLIKIHDVIQQLPPPHYRTLEFLMRHLSLLADYCSITNMHAKNLAIVWAPNLLRSEQPPVVGQVQEAPSIGLNNSHKVQGTAPAPERPPESRAMGDPAPIFLSDGTAAAQCPMGASAPQPGLPEKVRESSRAPPLHLRAESFPGHSCGFAAPVPPTRTMESKMAAALHSSAADATSSSNYHSFVPSSASVDDVMPVPLPVSQPKHASQSMVPPPKPERSHSLKLHHTQNLERDPSVLYQYQTHSKRQSSMTVVSQYDNLEDYHSLPQHQRGGFGGAGMGAYVPSGFVHPQSRTYATALGQGAFLPTELSLPHPDTQIHAE